MLGAQHAGLPRPPSCRSSTAAPRPSAAGKPKRRALASNCHYPQAWSTEKKINIYNCFKKCNKNSPLRSSRSVASSRSLTSHDQFTPASLLRHNKHHPSDRCPFSRWVRLVRKMSVILIQDMEGTLLMIYVSICINIVLCLIYMSQQYNSTIYNIIVVVIIFCNML